MLAGCVPPARAALVAKKMLSTALTDWQHFGPKQARRNSGFERREPGKRAEAAEAMPKKSGSATGEAEARGRTGGRGGNEKGRKKSWEWDSFLVDGNEAALINTDEG